jgi:glucan phosphorylase
VVDRGLRRRRHRLGDRRRWRRSDQQKTATALYDKLEHTVLPLYYTDAARWRWMMKQTIGNIAYYLNSQRMMRRYATEAYLR